MKGAVQPILLFIDFTDDELDEFIVADIQAWKYDAVDLESVVQQQTHLTF
jgi:hypothetical protein